MIDISVKLEWPLILHSKALVSVARLDIAGVAVGGTIHLLLPRCASARSVLLKSLRRKALEFRPTESTRSICGENLV